MSTKSLKLVVLMCIFSVIISSLIIFNSFTDMQLQNPSPITEHTAHEHPKITQIHSYKKQLLARDKLIIGNPLHSAQCRNAIIDKENIDITDLLITHLPQIYNIKSSNPAIKRMLQFLQKRPIPQLWGREQINALKHNTVWWSGARAHVSFDPFWYFERNIETNESGDDLEFHKKQLRFQYNTVEYRFEDKERMPWFLEMVHFAQLFSNNESINQSMQTQATEYNFNIFIKNKDAFKEYKNRYSHLKNVSEIVYYHIPKCGSTSMREMLHNIGGTRLEWRQSWFDGYPNPKLLHKNIKCGFAFVRSPIHRFISAYYTIQMMLVYDTTIGEFVTESDRNGTLKVINAHLRHWNMSDECYDNYSCLLRVKVFIEQLVSHSWKWINKYTNALSKRVMEHIGTISGHFLASFDGWEIDYIGKLEYFDRHWRELSLDISECSHGYLEKYWHGLADEFKGNMHSQRKGSVHRQIALGQRGKRTLGRPLTDAYYALALNRRLFDKLVDYYYQDFVCFDYDMSYDSFMEYILANDPLFDRNEFPSDLFEEK